MEAALKERATLRDADAPPKSNSQQETEQSKPVNVGLKGVSQSLIDKVRKYFIELKNLPPFNASYHSRFELVKRQKHRNR